MVATLVISYHFLILSVIWPYVCSAGEIIQCPGKHEKFRACGPPCPPTCYDLIEKSICRKEDVCVKGCFCQQGFYRNADNECVLPEDCFPEASCKSSLEVYDDCRANCQHTCDNYGKKFECPKKCKAGCVCIEGFVRNEEGNCIPPKFCKKLLDDPLPCGSSLEDFHYCRAACEDTCQNYGTEYNCSEDCKAGCVCKEGLVRDDNGRCIMPKYCKNLTVQEGFCGGQHEIFACGSPCDVKCSNLGEPCKKFSVHCVKKCYCQRGYARDHRNVCIPIRKCPTSTKSLQIFSAFHKALKKTVNHIKNKTL